MKIGIVTITNGENYGNRLQNYAMQKIFVDLGNEVETIQKESVVPKLKWKIKFVIRKLLRIRYNNKAKRIEAFSKFNKKNIKFSKNTIKSDNIDTDLSAKYDIFVCGSDQIWNPNFPINTDSFFLSFVKGKKKVAIAASFGIDEIKSEKEKLRIGKLLNELDAISIREKEGKIIVDKLSHKKAEVVIDPTLMLEPEQWMEIEEKPHKFANKKYIFCYLLGNYEKKLIRDIREYAQENNLEIVFLENDYNDFKITTEEEFSLNPAEFIWLLRNSEKVITDSFHAVIFSLLFRKKFLVIPRDITLGNMNSRFVSLSNMFGIKDYIYKNNKNFETSAVIDYELFEESLREERKKLYDFIKLNVCL